MGMNTAFGYFAWSYGIARKEKIKGSLGCYGVEVCQFGSSPISVGGKLLDDGITMRGSWKKSRSKNVR